MTAVGPEITYACRNKRVNWDTYVGSSELRNDYDLDLFLTEVIDVFLLVIILEYIYV